MALRRSSVFALIALFAIPPSVAAADATVNKAYDHSGTVFDAYPQAPVAPKPNPGPLNLGTPASRPHAEFRTQALWGVRTHHRFGQPRNAPSALKSK